MLDTTTRRCRTSVERSVTTTILNPSNKSGDKQKGADKKNLLWWQRRFMHLMNSKKYASRHHKRINHYTTAAAAMSPQGNNTKLTVFGDTIRECIIRHAGDKCRYVTFSVTTSFSNIMFVVECVCPWLLPDCLSQFQWCLQLLFLWRDSHIRAI